MPQSNMRPCRRHISWEGSGKLKQEAADHPLCCCQRSGGKILCLAGLIPKLNTQAQMKNCIKNVHSCSITFNRVLMQSGETKAYLLHSKNIKVTLYLDLICFLQDYKQAILQPITKYLYSELLHFLGEVFSLSRNRNKAT